MGGISNVDIEKYFNNEPNEDIKKKNLKDLCRQTC